MSKPAPPGAPGFVSTGSLPSRDDVRALIETAYARFREERSGTVADYKIGRASCRERV